MRPLLIKFDGFGIPSYGTMLVISFIVALFLVKREAKKHGIAPVTIENLAFWLMVGVIIGGRILYVIFHPSEFRDVVSIFEIWNGGMMFFGGFIGAFIAGAIYVKKQNLSIPALGDMVSPSIALGEFFTRIGCFLNGCCFGTPTTLPWGVRFPAGSFAWNAGFDHPVHPTQLYSSLFGLLLFFFLQRMLLHKHKEGQVFSYFLIFYGGFRFGVDFIRYYENVSNFLINQIISIIIVFAGLILLVRARQESQQSP
ncbi:MAG: prolipoprotein diacylglyceryl transferase [candidate division WOR-3 bacterium]|nr:prolipoprotein diacylglyceryl transferase [candidate division WOR-3 bacterium]